MLLARGLVWWLVASMLAALTPLALREELTGPAAAPAPDLALVLRGTAALALVGCVAWWWVATTAVLVSVAAGRRARPPGCPRWVHRAVLVGLGLGLTAGLASPASAAPTSHAVPGGGTPGTPALVEGLPYPDRATSAAPSAYDGPGVVRRAAHAVDGRYVVSPGDTLWAIARRDLGPGASPTSVEARWREIYRANLTVVGSNPDLILPGTPLVLPPHSPDGEEPS